MVSLRSRLYLVAGAVVIGIMVLIGWFIAGNLFATLISVVIGAVISLLAQIRTQKIEWKREYSVKVVEEVYSHLFRHINDFIRTKEMRGYERTGFVFWDEVQKDHRYFMVEKELRSGLDSFAKRVNDYDDAISEFDFQILPKTVVGNAKTIFHVEGMVDVQNIILNIVIGQKDFRSIDICHSLKQRLNLSDVVDRILQNEHVNRAEISNLGLKIEIKRQDGLPTILTDKEKIEEFYDVCLKIIKNNSKLQFVINENKNLLVEAKEIKNKLIKRLEKPWEI